MAVWSVGGFLAVAAFWMVVGLISLTDSTPRTSAPPPDAPRSEAPGCTALSLDRQLGNTTAEPCRRAPSLRDVLASRQADPARP